ncbi:SAF domain-containing protein [Nitrobacter sp. NHB1]|uniref:SAF domain-containing protein n=1 Tax=Nitrobacter sp. NHB1 TaxID=3119830 RepID=UPI003FA548A8
MVEAVAAGEVFIERNIRAIRPGYGLAPYHLDLILNRRAAHVMKRGTPLTSDDALGSKSIFD